MASGGNPEEKRSWLISKQDLSFYIDGRLQDLSDLRPASRTLHRLTKQLQIRVNKAIVQTLES